MAGGAYYLYNKKGTNNSPRVPNSNPDFVAKNELPGEPDTQRLQDLAKDLAINDLTKNLTKDQKNLIADQKDLYKNLKNFTKDTGLIIALGFNLTEDQKDLNSNLNKDLNKLAKDEELIIGLAFDFIDSSEN
jgi:RecG-like helicase